MAKSLFASMPAFLSDKGARPELGDVMGFYRMLFGVYGLIAITFLVPKLVSVLFNEFVLPFYLIERLTLGEATARGFRLLSQNVGSTVLYMICKFFLFFIGAMAQNLVTQLVMLPFILVGVVFAVLVGIGHGSTGIVGRVCGGGRVCADRAVSGCAVLRGDWGDGVFDDGARELCGVFCGEPVCGAGGFVAAATAADLRVCAAAYAAAAGRG